jgi:hypothetical protein
MSSYLEFETGDGATILVEVDELPATDSPGVAKAPWRGEAAVDSARRSFTDAMESTINTVATAAHEAIERLARSPSEVELTFALKATGEVGNFAIAKIGGEANFGIRLIWRQTAAKGGSP